VFTGLLDLRKPGEYPYLVMDQEGNGAVHRGRPPYDRMGTEIRFHDLPQACQRLVMKRYRVMWDIAVDDGDVAARIPAGAERGV